MEALRSKPSYEGLQAYAKALERAQDVLKKDRLAGIKSVHRIARSLQTFPELKDPKVVQAVQELQKAKDDEIVPFVKALLTQLIAFSLENAPKGMKVLIVEDDLIVARILQKELRSNQWDLFHAASLKEGRTLLDQHDMSLILLDLTLPDGDGRDFLLSIRQHFTTKSIPVMILSSHQEPETKTECFALGADAYFEKPVSSAMLSAAMAMKLQYLSEATHQSSVDTVTRLPNRKVFYSAFARVMRVVGRTKEPVSIAILDLDRFKSVNDISGHHMGDLVLQRIAALLVKTLRASDLVVRWGGEEFAVLFPNTDLNQACMALNKALGSLRKQNFETPEGRVFKMTFSAGVTQVKKGDTVEQSIAEADRYLYLAKAAGRNHVLSKEDPLDNLRRNILLVEDDDFMASLLRRFLEKEGFRIFHARDGKTAQALCSQAAFSLITLDVKLPDIDGFELLNQFRQTPTLRHVPVIMLTATANEQDVIRGFQLGADDYILKPFSPSQFMARVNRFLEKQS